MVSRIVRSTPTLKQSFGSLKQSFGRVNYLRRTLTTASKAHCSKVSMLSLLLFGSLTTSMAFCADKHHEEYFDFIKKSNLPLGDASKGEIQIVPERISEAEQKFKRSIGITAQNKYMKLVEDPVLFPSGALGVYMRIIGGEGAAIIPVLPDGRIVLLCHYRHALRDFRMEVPRGNMNKSETAEDVARREGTEETGFQFGKVVYLGTMNPDSGSGAGKIPVFLGYVEGYGNHSRDDTEAISHLQAFTVAQIREGILRGYLEYEKGGKTIRTPIQDPFLTFGLFQANLEKR